MSLFRRRRNEKDNNPIEAETEAKRDNDKKVVDERLNKAKGRLRRLKAEVETIRREP